MPPVRLSDLWAAELAARTKDLREISGLLGLAGEDTEGLEEFDDLLPRLSDEQIRDLFALTDQDLTPIRQDWRTSLRPERVEAIRRDVRAGAVQPDIDGQAIALARSLEEVQTRSGVGQALHTLLTPLRLYSDNIALPFTATVVDAVQRLLPGTQEVEARALANEKAGMGYVKARVEAWKQADMPGWTRFGLELLLDPLVVAGAAKLAITAPAKLMAATTVKGLAIPRGAATPLFPTLPTFAETALHIQPNPLTRVPGLRGLGKLADPSASLPTAEGVSPMLGMNVHARWQTVAEGYTALMAARMRAILPNAEKSFAIKEGRVTNLPGSPAWGDVFQAPHKYPGLADQQRLYIKTIQDMTDEVKSVFKTEGIDLEELGFLDEAMHYIPRFVTGRLIHRGVKGEERLLERVSPPSRVLGAKTPFEKTRLYYEMREGLAKGFRYADPSEMVQIYLSSAYRRVADKRLASYLEPLARAAKLGPTKFTEGVVGGQPAFRNMVFTGEEGREVAAGIEKFLAATRSPILAPFEDVSGALRIMGATLDASAPMITSLGLLARNPSAWGKSVGAMFDAIFSPNTLDKYLARNADDVIDLVRSGGLLSSNEFFEGLRGSGILARAQGAKGTGPLIRQSFGRFSASFDALMDVGRLEYWKGMKTMGRTPADKAALASFANKLVGSVSTRNLGVGVTQRQFESSLLSFSPRFFRSTVGIVLDLAQSGVRKQEAARTLSHLLVGGTAFYVAAATALGQTPRLDPTKGDFFSLLFTDLDGKEYNLTFGAKFRSLIRLAGNMAKQAGDDPVGLVTLGVLGDEKGIWNNAVGRWWRGQAAPSTTILLEMVTGTDAMGRTLPNPDEPLPWAAYYTGHALPFAIQAAWEEGQFERPGPAALIAAELGGNVNPQAKSRQRDALRDGLARASGERRADGVLARTWKDLDRSQQTTIRSAHPELVQAEESARTAVEQFASSREVVLVGKMLDANRTVYAQALDQAARRFESGVDGEQAGYTLRQAVSAAGDNLRATNDVLVREHPVYFADIEARRKSTQPLDLAYEDLIRTLYATWPEDEFGRTDWQEVEERKVGLADRWGAELMEKVYAFYEEQRRNPRVGSIPQAVLDLWDAREKLRPYWELDKVILKKPTEQALWTQYRALTPDQQRDLLRSPLGERYAQVVGRMQEAQIMWKTQHPDEDWLLYKFYGLAPVAPRNVHRRYTQS